ncbi:uncharacterized protein B0H18DRAFT_683622 [Fomitopsis serialis]|uniref:uncharacterized protein n=1 Tax=Fomitopsis serialis TaxID=139415 RepID=UPI0020078781|nr:uncharacterized protein B0H18DRAFT_683622 [Neoantrodia serialis]KAH9917990.1 hypothetical protein B0H18DRAFT_683622 [Neoantrodia serialis]
MTDSTLPDAPTFLTASPPFDNPDADMIIRTSDHVDFRVHKFILREVSPIFADMMSLPPTRDSSGVVDVTEDSVVWDHILRMCYPFARPAAIAPDRFWPLLEAAKKYAMQGVRETAGREMLASTMLEQAPLRVYALACGYGLHDVAIAAARASLRQPLDEDTLVPELRCVTSAAYFNLLQYRRNCVKAATAFVDDCKGSKGFWREGWGNYTCGWAISPPNTEPKHDPRCFNSAAKIKTYKLYQPTGSKQIHVILCPARRVFEDYITRSAEALEATPHGAVVLDPHIIAATVQQASICAVCRTNEQADQIVRFIKFHASDIDAAVAKVELKIEA